jgi:plasmid stabilization system protein ParE
MKLFLRPRAKLDLDDAYAWYEQQRIGLGDELLNEIESTLQTIIERPYSFPVVEQNARRALAKRFPYGIFFTADETEIVIFAIYHAKRNPRGWKSRL